MSAPEVPNWRTERGFIATEQARIAAEQAEELRARAPGFVEAFEPADRSWGDDLTVLKVALRGFRPQDREVFAEFADVAAAVNQAAGGTPEDDVFLNFYEPAASTGAHRDGYVSRTVAVGLKGVANAYIWDDEREAWQPPVPMYAGDVLYFDNTVAEAERPLHVIQNVRDMPRVALVNAAQ